jgi:dephospho-CoA kinase
MTSPHPPLLLSPELSRSAASLGEKDQRRLDDVLRQLHTVNGRLWAAEDLVRTPGLAIGQVADAKREIDQLNGDRNTLAERADEILGLLAPVARDETPVHTETLATVLDRLSVLTWRIWHTGRAADDDELARRRLPLLHRQAAELRSGLDTLISEVLAGQKRLPAAARYKLYRAATTEAAEISPSRHLHRVLAIGGLSECGKSTSAEYLRRTCGAGRFKIGYLLRQAAQRHGLSNPYALSPRRQAELLLEELNRLADAHVDTGLFTIESVHDNASIAELKRMLGEVLQIIYLDVPFEIRVARSGTSAAEVAGKDEIKRSRGAHQVTSLADHVIDNSGSVLSLRSALRRIALPPVGARLQAVPAYGLALPGPVAGATGAFVDAVRDIGPAVHLIALTGSPGEKSFIDGWSDLDLFVVADETARAEIGAAVDHYQAAIAATASIGLTLATPQELADRLITPRLAFCLYQMQHGHPVLHAAPDLRLPRISETELQLAVVRELPQVILTTRRLRASAGPTSLRPLYKHLVLACRLLLREHSVWEAGADRILDAAAAHLPGLGTLAVPPLTEIAAAWRADAADAALKPVIEAVDQLLTWYAAQLAA